MLSKKFKKVTTANLRARIRKAQAHGARCARTAKEFVISGDAVGAEISRSIELDCIADIKELENEILVRANS